MVIRLLPYWTLLLIVCCCFFPFLRKYLCNLHSFLSVMYSNCDEVILSLDGEMMMFFFPALACADLHHERVGHRY